MKGPFWSDIDTTKIGDIYFREMTSESSSPNEFDDLYSIDMDINSYAKLNDSIFRSTWAMVVTWSEVTYHTRSYLKSIPKNTFQLILAQNRDQKNSSLSFGIFNYIKMEWPQFSNKNVRQQHPFLAGYNSFTSMFNQKYEVIERSKISNLLTRSNVNKPGKWIFKF